VSDGETANKVQSRRYFEEVWNKGDFAVADEILARDYVDHNSSYPPGREGVRAELSIYRRAFPDLRFSVEDIIAEGDKVATRVSATGTHQGDLPGIPATGKRVAVSGIVIFRYENGKAAEAWMSYDFLGLYRQLGVVPAR
jgi:steroid delta-isomerase-like uncharacterized protein